MTKKEERAREAANKHATARASMYMNNIQTSYFPYPARIGARKRLKMTAADQANPEILERLKLILPIYHTFKLVEVEGVPYIEYIGFSWERREHETDV